MTFAPLYNDNVIKKKFSDIEVTTKQRKLANAWIDKIKNKELEKEVENYDVFRETILIELLGYPRDEIKFEVKDVEFSVTDVQGTTHVVFEAKGTKTKDLFARQNYGKKEQENPVLQTVSNMQRFAPPAAYGVCTNYNDFVLLDRDLGITKCHKFVFTDIKNNLEKLKEFIGIFSYGKLVKEKSLVILYEKSLTVEKEFTEEFYKLFHETRLMLIKAFQEKEGVTKNNAIYFTQIFLNRLIFIFFVEDRGFVSDNHLFTNRMYTILESVPFSKYSKKVYNEIMELFVAFDKGDPELGVFGFNGGLFSGEIPHRIYFSDLKEPDFFSDVRQNSKLLKSTKLNEKAQKILDKYRDQFSPIISNLLLMDSFDFNTEVNVNILGHIFEQSISDLEELKNIGVSRRKTFGVYYTPEYITDYICRHTIIQYLSKSGVNTVDELIREYKNNLDELEVKFKNIQILDPSCGSGAFLIKAIDTLLEIHKGIQEYNQSSEKYSTGGQFKLTPWNEETEIRAIIENNIYGVDINPESIEITKLSLFLKLASNNRKLLGLSKNIKVGNSLVDDKSVDERAFSWQEQFPHVFHDPKLKKHESELKLSKKMDDGFDIVIGNPPYVKSRDKIISDIEKEAIESNFNSAIGMWDLYVPFMQLGLDLLKTNGKFGMIVKDTLGEASYTSNLISFIENKNHLYQIDFFPGVKVFGNKVGVENKIAFVEKKISKEPSKRILHNPTIYDIETLPVISGLKKYVACQQEIQIDTSDCFSLGDICIASYGLRLNSDKGDKKFKFKKKDLLSQKKNSKNNRIYTEGKHIGEFVISKNLYVEWGTERSPKRLVRPTFPELYAPEKLLMSRQKRITAYSDQGHICDNTIIVGVLAKDLENVENSHLKTYYDNIQTPRKEIEKNSRGFRLKYILGILNSSLAKYFLKHNSGGKIDSYPDDWKKIPIKNISLLQQNNIEKKVKNLIELHSKIVSRRIHLKEKISNDFEIDLKLSKIISHEDSGSSLSFLIEKILKKKLTFDVQSSLDDYFERYSDELKKSKTKIKESKADLNDSIYDIYDVSINAQKIIESDLFG